MPDQRSAVCLNCDAPLASAFCAYCGQKAVPADLTLRQFFHETTHELTHWEGKIPATLKTLLIEPGVLTVDFLAGRRARWLTPLRVYLICSVVFFASKPVIEGVTGRAPRDIARVTIKNDDGSTTLTPEGRQALAESPWARFFGVERLERAVADPGRLNREIDAAFSKAMFVLLPVFALLTNLAWRRKYRRYPAHLYIALHLHAALFIALTVSWMLMTFIPSTRTAPIVTLLYVAYLAWYGLTALHRIFGDSWPKTIVKTVGVAVVYFACFLAVGMVLVGYTVMRM